MNEAILGSFGMIYFFTADLFEIFVPASDEFESGLGDFDKLLLNSGENF